MVRNGESLFWVESGRQPTYEMSAPIYVVAEESKMTDRVETVQQLYSAFAEGDAVGLQNLLADTHWVEAAGMPYGGIYRGFGQIAENVFGPINNDVQGFTAKPDEIIPAGDDRVLVLGTYRGTGSNGEVATPFAHLWTVREARITNFVQYVDTHLFRQSIGA